MGKLESRGEVDAENQFVLRARRLQQREGTQVHRGVVNHGVEAAAAVENPLDQGRGLAGLGEIGLQPGLARNSPGVEVVPGHTPPAFSQDCCQPRADAPPHARDEDHARIVLHVGEATRLRPRIGPAAFELCALEWRDHPRSDVAVYLKFSTGIKPEL